MKELGPRQTLSLSRQSVLQPLTASTFSVNAGHDVDIAGGSFMSGLRRASVQAAERSLRSSVGLPRPVQEREAPLALLPEPSRRFSATPPLEALEDQRNHVAQAALIVPEAPLPEDRPLHAERDVVESSQGGPAFSAPVGRTLLQRRLKPRLRVGRRQLVQESAQERRCQHHFDVRQSPARSGLRSGGPRGVREPLPQQAPVLSQ
mmetsp:Transcript_51112/g.143932  ORF Transcript_51112/g.143932 Transcript_51112/m.143932 type:complete len:205 (+) Transcript_51112:3-617(+)